MRPHEINHRIASKSSKMQITALIWRLDRSSRTIRCGSAGTAATQLFMKHCLPSRGSWPLEGEPCGQLKLTSGSDGGEYSADVVGEIASCIFKDRVAVPSQGKRALCITRNTKIRMV